MTTWPGMKTRLRTCFSTLALVALLGQPALAAGIPIEISADTFTIDQNQQKATFSGNVVIKRKDLDMQAQSVTVVYGKGGQSDIDSLTASGNVHVKTPSQDVRGDRAVFDPDAQTVRVSGNVRVSNAQGQVNGPELVINLKQNTTVFQGGKGGGRVTGVFTPQ